MNVVIDLLTVGRVETKLENDRLKIHLIGGMEGPEWTSTIEILLPPRSDKFVLPSHIKSYQQDMAAKLEELLTAIADALTYFDPARKIKFTQKRCWNCGHEQKFYILARDLCSDRKKFERRQEDGRDS